MVDNVLMLPTCCAPFSFDDGKGQEGESSNLAPRTTPGPHQNPKPCGKLHSTLQQVDSLVHDVPSLRRFLKEDDPILNWQSKNQVIDLCDMKSWFPKDDQPAFYTPVDNSSSNDNNNNSRYDHLTYRQLHEALHQCPPFNNEGTSHREAANVAIVLPVDQMAHMAMALLSTIAAGAVAVPLDPRMPTLRVLEAMLQLQCRCFVASSKSILLEGASPLLRKHADGISYQTNMALFEECTSSQTQDNRDCYSEETKRLVSFFHNQVDDIRILTCGVCGRLEWTVLEKIQSDDGTVWRPKKSTKTIETAPRPVKPDDTAILLRTSGTTSKPKVVPISRSMLAFAGTSIAAALDLKRSDCNCNSMPFYHIGGIACNLLSVLISGGSVLLAGPLTDPNMFLDHLESSPDRDVKAPTWYYAGPSMHKAILLMAEARWEANHQYLPNQLRFIRSASAHLNHDMALHLSKVFQCQVIPTYGMSEAMPICSSAPIDVRNNPPCQVIDSVGYSVGTSIRILDPETDEVLPYGSSMEQIGEIAVKGHGVISHYMGLDVAKTHTADGWLKTGDRGLLDRHGRLFIKGRSKEMIKRGGEQVWPNEIDDVVEKVSGVATAVTFGVPNELWGEEVAVAVILRDAKEIENKAYLKAVEDEIMRICRSKLDNLSMPQQIKFLPSTDYLLKGSTGKYIRSKMAGHLGVTSVDTGALRILESSSALFTASAAQIMPTTSDVTASFGEKATGKWDWLNSKSEDGRRVMPSDALNGMRFFVACIVVHVHVGRYPNLYWLKMQAYQPNMMIFFGIGSFQIACSVARSVKGRWANFVGSKIGSLHALFVIAQLFTLPSYILFMAFDDDGNLDWDVKKWIGFSLFFLFATITGMGHGYDVNKYTWFQSTFYMFLVLFPFVDDYLRKQTIKVQGIWLMLFGAAAAGLWGLMYLTVPSDVFWGPLYPVGWSIVTWLPMLVTGMVVAYFFRRIAEYYLQRRDKDLEDQQHAPRQMDDPDTLLVEEVRDYSKVWGIVCDACSLLLLVAAMLVTLAPNCLCVFEDTSEAMRPGGALPNEECPFSRGRDNYVWTCGITYNEFINYIQPDPNHNEYGRFPSLFSGAFGYLRTSAPLILLWIASMGFGNGYTARFFSSKLITTLAPLGYPVYLLHMAVARYYWLATRGFEREAWFDISGEYPFPVEWHEMLIVLAITIFVGFLINAFLVPPLIPYTISWGVKVCTFISSCFARVSCNKNTEDTTDNTSFEGEIKVSTYDQVKTMVRGLTGVDVNRSVKLSTLGLDSLGATALLGMLRASVPAARSLSLQELQQCETVGCLANTLDSEVSQWSTSEEDNGGSQSS